MLLRIAESLDVPLRERNRMLLAAGFAPAYSATPVSDPSFEAARAAIRTLLTAHEPYPAIAVDGQWNLVEANRPMTLFLEGVDASLLVPPVNVLRVSLHPNGLGPRILNFGEWRAHILERLRKQLEASADPELHALIEELAGYPNPSPAGCERSGGPWRYSDSAAIGSLAGRAELLHHGHRFRNTARHHARGHRARDLLPRRCRHRGMPASGEHHRHLTFSSPLAASIPSATPKRAIASIPAKSQSSLYSSDG